MVKKTECLYRISALLLEKGLSVETVLRESLSILSSFLEHAGDRQVRVIADDQMADLTFSPLHAPKSSPLFSCPLVVQGTRAGALEIAGGGLPLTAGERDLAEAAAGLLGRIIEQKQTEKKLLENEKSFRTLVEDSPTGIFIVQNGRVVYENPEEKRLSGPLRHLLGDGDTSNIHPEDAAKVDEGFKKIMAREVKNLDIDFRFFTRESEEKPSAMKWVHCRASLINFKGDEAVLVNKLDVTRTKELEFLLRTEDKMASLGRIASGMAHEIRNPLSGINIYLSNLEKALDGDIQTEKAKEIIGELRSASNRIESVIRRVMDFSRPSEPRFLRISINQPILDAIKLSSVTLRKAGIALHTSLAEDIPLCRADPHLMEQVFMNLITNAKEAMKETVTGKRIDVSSFAADDRILVVVADSGPGIPAHMRKRIFDPFYTTKDGNTGIGLSLCNRIIVDHGGTLSLFDSDHGGAEFRIALPREGSREDRAG